MDTLASEHKGATGNKTLNFEARTEKKLQAEAQKLG
jgi:hypothetical protein